MYSVSYVFEKHIGANVICAQVMHKLYIDDSVSCNVLRSCIKTWCYLYDTL